MNKKTEFTNNILVLGYGSIAKATIPLIFEQFAIEPSQVKIIAKEPDVSQTPDQFSLTVLDHTLTKQNYVEILREHVSAGDLLVNLTAEVSSLDLMEFCSNERVLYLDTCIEMWPEEIDVNSKTFDERNLLLDLQTKLHNNDTTLLSSMGANPGIVSLLTKRLMLQIAAEVGHQTTNPVEQSEWGKLAYDLGVRAIHVNERDTQYSSHNFPATTFVSTWSVEAMIVESIEVAEMAIGSHESLPPGAVLSGDTDKRAIHFTQPGKDVQIKTWLPNAGEQHGMILNHNEPFSIAELYIHRDDTEEHSPTVCFAYHPSDQTMKSLESLTKDNYEDLDGHLLLHDIEGGMDELGVLIITKSHGAFWLGSQLTIEAARAMNPESSATSLQVAGGVVAGMNWIANNPNAGLLEPEDIKDHDTVLNLAEKYWGGFVYQQSDWRPPGSSDQLLLADFLKHDDTRSV